MWDAPAFLTLCLDISQCRHVFCILQHEQYTHYSVINRKGCCACKSLVLNAYKIFVNTLTCIIGYKVYAPQQGDNIPDHRFL